jgi:hypothetical protein
MVTQRRVLFVFVPLAMLFIAGLAYRVSIRNGTSDILSKLAIGSSVASVEPLLSLAYVRGSSVRRQVRSEGVYRTEELGDYRSPKATKSLKGPFTGEVTLFIDGLFGNDTAILLKFRNGRLIEKDWGYLPG